MRVGILGSGLMGAKLGTIFARAGHDLIFSYAQQEHLATPRKTRMRTATHAIRGC